MDKKSINHIIRSATLCIIIVFYEHLSRVPYWGITVESPEQMLNDRIIFVPKNETNIGLLNLFLGNNSISIVDKTPILRMSSPNKNTLLSCEIAYFDEARDNEVLEYSAVPAKRTAGNWIASFLMGLQGRVFCFQELR